MTLEERALRVLEEAKPQENGCLFFNGATHSDGYGWLNFQRKNWLSHRFVFAAFRKSIPKGMLILHRCGNRRCVNPEHLYAGKHKENARDSVIHRTWKWGKSELKLLPEEVLQIRAEYEAGKCSQQSLANRFGVCQRNISLIVRREIWKHI